MATIPSITVPDAIVPDAIVAIEAALTARGINFGAMTSIQKTRTYIIEVLKDTYVQYKKTTAEVTAATTVNSTVTQARTDAAGIV